MPIFPRFLHASRDIPEHGIAAGDLVRIDPREPFPVVSIRAHGANVGAMLGLESDGALVAITGVIGFPSFRQPSEEASLESQGQAERPQAG